MARGDAMLVTTGSSVLVRGDLARADVCRDEPSNLIADLVPGRPTEAAVRALSRFDHELAVDPARLEAALLVHPSVRESDEPAAYPPPPIGQPLLLYRHVLAPGRPGERKPTLRFGLRHYAGPLDVPSPCLVFDVEPTANGCRVRGRLLRRDPTLVASFDSRWVVRSLLYLLAATLTIPLVLMWTSLGAGAIGLITAMVLHMGILFISMGARLRRDGPPRWSTPDWWSSPTPRQIARYGGRMWHVFGDVVLAHRVEDRVLDALPYRR